MEINTGRVDRKELKWTLAMSAVLFFLTSIPYLLGAFFQDDQWIFSGFYFNVEDGNSYIAKMLNGSHGEWLFITPYSVYPQKGFLAFFPYILFGKLAAPPALHEQLLVLFQFFRLLGGTVMMVGTYSFIAVFLEEVWARRICTLICVIGGGWGWLYFLGMESLWGSRIPLEFYSPETFGFLSFFSLPHLSMARGLLLLSFRMFLMQSDDTQSKNHNYGGVILLFVGIFQPLTIIIGWAVIGVYIMSIIIERIYRKEQLDIDLLVRKYYGYFLFPSLIVFYTFFSFNLDPYLSGWATQNIILSPPFVDYLLSFGIFLIAAISVAVLFRFNDTKVRFLVVWLGIVPIMIYFPINLQRRLAEGIWVAMIVLVFILIERSRHRRVLYPISLAISLISPIAFLVGGITQTMDTRLPIYAQRSMIMLVEDARHIIQADDVLIADQAVSNVIPAYLNIRTVVGHGPESVNPGFDLSRIDVLFSGIDDPSIHPFVCGLSARWVLTRSGRLPNSGLLEECCHIAGDNMEFTLYQVNDGFCKNDQN